MISKSFAFILLLVLSVAAIAQDAPETKTSKESKEDNARKAYSVAISGFGGGSYLGVYMGEVTQENFSKYGLSSVRGVAVTRVSDDSPAAKAGLKENDVIVGFNGEAVTSVRKLRRLVSEVAPDHTAKVTFMRGGSERNVDVKMAKRSGTIFSRSGNTMVFPAPNIEIPRVPRIPDMPRVQIAPGVGRGIFRISSRSIGARLTPLTDQLGEYFGVSDGQGLLVTSVGKDSAAAKGGLKAGDVIVEIDGKKVSRTYDLIHALGQKKEGEVNLKIVRDKQSRTITVTPEKSKNGNEFFFEGLNWTDEKGKGNNIVIEDFDWVTEDEGNK